MQRGDDDARTTGPRWDPAGNVLFPRVRSRGTCMDQRGHRHYDPSQQAAALQRGLGGFARIITVRPSP
eukprot:2681746-Pyramimonas_sp.AAC.1